MSRAHQPPGRQLETMDRRSEDDLDNGHPKGPQQLGPPNKPLSLSSFTFTDLFEARLPTSQYPIFC